MAPRLATYFYHFPLLARQRGLTTVSEQKRQGQDLVPVQLIQKEQQQIIADAIIVRIRPIED